MSNPISFNRKDRPDFYRVLQKRVNQYFKDKQLSKHYNAHMLIKTLVMYALYIVPFVLILSNNFTFLECLGLYSIMSIGLLGIGTSIMHDAIHLAYSKHKWVNQLLGYSLNLIGGNSFNWFIQHNVLHHTYTNIPGADSDISSEPVLRMSPTDKWKPFHRFQHIYAIAVYGISNLFWISVKDFIQLNKYDAKGLINEAGSTYNKEVSKVILSKIVYFSYILGLPVLMTELSLLEAFLGLILMHLIAGILLTCTFQMAHMVEPTEFPLPNEEQQIQKNWAAHQICTTANFGKNNHILSWFIGGLNYQVEHHLFPGICHIHYPAIAPIIKQTAEEYNLPYLEFGSFSQAFSSHLRKLKAMGQEPKETLKKEASSVKEEATY